MTKNEVLEKFTVGELDNPVTYRSIMEVLMSIDRNEYKKALVNRCPSVVRCPGCEQFNCQCEDRTEEYEENKLGRN